MKKAHIHLAASRIHKWLALIIGIQFLLWFTSGLVMSILPIEKTRGEHLVARHRGAVLPAGIDLSKLKVGPVQTIHIVVPNGRALAWTEQADGRTQLFDVASGARQLGISSSEAVAIARAAWLGNPAARTTVAPVSNNSIEYGGRVPAWRVTFDQPADTRVYVESQTGKISAVRTANWRIYDFFWSLHIMDWKTHENFNTPWLIAFAAGALVMGLAGVLLLVFRWPMRIRRRRV